MELATRPEDPNANGYTTILALFGVGVVWVLGVGRYMYTNACVVIILCLFCCCCFCLCLLLLFCSFFFTYAKHILRCSTPLAECSSKWEGRGWSEDLRQLAGRRRAQGAQTTPTQNNPSIHFAAENSVSEKNITKHIQTIQTVRNTYTNTFKNIYKLYKHSQLGKEIKNSFLIRNVLV